MATSMGMERSKYSRLDQKEVMKFSLKGITLPQNFMDVIAQRYSYQFRTKQGLQAQIPSAKELTLFRLRLELGDFQVYSTFFFPQDTSKIVKGSQFQIELTEDI